MRYAKLQNILEVVSILGIFGCGLWVFYLTPIETEMGFIQKIMYLHVPSVIVTYFAFFVVFACAIAYLWKRDMLFDRVAKASAEIGLIFCGLVLLTGSVWGRPTWGTYWVWDARLTTTLLLFLVFMGYFLLRMSTNDPEKEARLASVLGIIGFLDIPVIHKSVEAWKAWPLLIEPCIKALHSSKFNQERPSLPCLQSCSIHCLGACLQCLSSMSTYYYCAIVLQKNMINYKKCLQTKKELKNA